jgi:diguanylate cyclase (GGDEF)-like protein
MNKDNNVNGHKSILEETLDSLVVKRDVPRGVFVILLLLYIATSVAISISAASDKTIMFGNSSVAVYTFAGVLSSLANIFIIFMAIFCGKTGFIASVVVIMIQIPMILYGVIAKGRLSSLPGLFGYILTIVAIIIIRLNIRKVEKYQHRLREQATTDMLTGLPNRFAGYELIDELIRRNKPFAAVAIDVNDFKSINDTMGFDIGNRVLIEIASRWKNIADNGLAGTRDFVMRISSDEFALIIRNFNSDTDIVKTIRQYEEALNEKMSIEGYDFSITASFGYAQFPVDSNVRDSLLSYTVTAMKEIKRLNSGEHILHFNSDLLKLQGNIMIDNAVRNAVENDTVFFNLQPQFDIFHKLRGFEALARMKDSDGNNISPADFIPAAERMGLIDRIDLSVYKKAGDFFGSLLEETGANITLSINVSVKHLMKSSFIDEIKEILSECGIPANRLEIEITESIMIESPERASEVLDEIKAMGIRLAIDDFGTGYSSLGYLNTFPADILKVDKSFIDIMNTSTSNRQYVEAIISLGHIMGFNVIAEGVEEQEQLETLRSIECDYIQGFIWGKPLSPEEAKALAEEGK